MAEMRLIDANALKKKTRRMYAPDEIDSIAPIATTCITYDDVCRAPTIDAVPVVHARWVHEQRYGDSGDWVWRCSACRRESITCIISAIKYCHACGAKMDGGEEDA